MLTGDLLRRGKVTEIIELETTSLRLIAKLLHGALISSKDTSEKENAQIALDHLAFQSDVVKLDPKEYFTYPIRELQVITNP